MQKTWQGWTIANTAGHSSLFIKNRADNAVTDDDDDDDDDAADDDDDDDDDDDADHDDAADDDDDDDGDDDDDDADDHDDDDDDDDDVDDDDDDNDDDDDDAVDDDDDDAVDDDADDDAVDDDDDDDDVLGRRDVPRRPSVVLCLCLCRRLFVVLPGNCVGSSLWFLKSFLQSEKVSDKRDIILFLRLAVPKDSKQIKFLWKHVQHVQK